MSTNTSTEEKESEERKFRSEHDFEYTLDEMSRRDQREFQRELIYQQYYRGLYD